MTMSTTRDPNTDQIAPTPNDKPAVWLSVIEDMQQRHQHGVRKYGTALQPHNGRSALRDLYEELLDAAVYTKQRMLEEQGLILLSRDDAGKLALVVNFCLGAVDILEQEGGDEKDITEARKIGASARDILSRVGVMCPGCFRCSDFAETPDDGRWYLHNPPCPGSCDGACGGKVVEGKPCDGSGVK